MPIEEATVDPRTDREGTLASAATENVPSTSSSVVTHPTARRRRRSRHRHSSVSRRVVIKAVAVAGAVLIALVIMVMSIGLSSLSAENARLVTENNRKAREAEQMRTQLTAVTEQRDALVRGRIPRLKLLKYDQAIDLNQAYVRNVIFTLTRSSDAVTHEFRMVLHNDSLSVVNPQVKIVLFDAVGIQIGMATLNRSAVISQKDRTLLDPGEVRSYSGAIPVNGREQPMYFLVLAE